MRMVNELDKRREKNLKIGINGNICKLRKKVSTIFIYTRKWKLLNEKKLSFFVVSWKWKKINEKNDKENKFLLCEF